MTTTSDPSSRTRPLDFERLDDGQMHKRARWWFDEMDRRRSVRQFSNEPVARELIEDAIRTASTAPSGAHMQPWTFVVVSDAGVKARIREAAEAEEQRFYDERAPDAWLEALAPLGTDAVKTHITDAPYVVVLFRHRHGLNEDGSRRTYYYTSESCGIAAGMFIAAVHHMGLATLPHTPSPMGFLAEILERPSNEQAYLLLPVGFPAVDAAVPDIARKPLDAVSAWV
ncbi:nitroreductase family protein [soil metagenome]